MDRVFGLWRNHQRNPEKIIQQGGISAALPRKEGREMTRARFYRKTKELLDTTNDLIMEIVERKLSSGALDIMSYDDENYELPKILLCSALKEMSLRLEPLSLKGKHEVKNLSHF
jgi:hypothetical protein